MGKVAPVGALTCADARVDAANVAAIAAAATAVRKRALEFIGPL